MCLSEVADPRHVNCDWNATRLPLSVLIGERVVSEDELRSLGSICEAGDIRV